MTGTSAIVAAWVEAGATVVAVGAAFWAGVVATKAYGREVARDDAREEERKAAQAQLVAAWCPAYDYAAEVPATASSGPGYLAVHSGSPKPMWFYYVRNASPVPVYDLVFHFRQGDSHSLGTDSLGVLPPSDEPLTIEVPGRVESEARAGVEEHGDAIRVLVSFVDAGGRRWTRRWDGRLVSDQDRPEL